MANKSYHTTLRRYASEQKSHVVVEGLRDDSGFSAQCCTKSLARELVTN